VECRLPTSCFTRAAANSGLASPSGAAAASGSAPHLSHSGSGMRSAPFLGSAALTALPPLRLQCDCVQAANLGRRQLSAGADAALKGSECLGADTLLQLLKNYARNVDIKTAITVGVVGLPNVGKSSVINSLKRTRVAQVWGVLRYSWQLPVCSWMWRLAGRCPVSCLELVRVAQLGVRPSFWRIGRAADGIAAIAGVADAAGSEACLPFLHVVPPGSASTTADRLLLPSTEALPCCIMVPCRRRWATRQA
jgi:hypothetical protein